MPKQLTMPQLAARGDDTRHGGLVGHVRPGQVGDDDCPLALEHAAVAFSEPGAGHP